MEGEIRCSGSRLSPQFAFVWWQNEKEYFFYFGSTSTSPWVPFKVKFRPLGRPTPGSPLFKKRNTKILECQLSKYQYLCQSSIKCRGQKYFNIARVLQEEWLTIFTCLANTCTCPSKAYAGVIWLTQVILHKALVLWDLSFLDFLDYERTSGIFVPWNHGLPLDNFCFQFSLKKDNKVHAPCPTIDTVSVTMPSVPHGWKFKISKILNFLNSKLKTCSMFTKLIPTISSLNGQLSIYKLNINFKKALRICLIEDFEADFLWKVGLKILNSGIILKTFTHVTSFSDWIPNNQSKIKKIFINLSSLLTTPIFFSRLILLLVTM